MSSAQTGRHHRHVMDKHEAVEGHAMPVRVKRAASAVAARGLLEMTRTVPVVEVHPIVALDHRLVDMADLTVAESLADLVDMADLTDLTDPTDMAAHPIPSGSLSMRWNSMPMETVCLTKASC